MKQTTILGPLILFPSLVAILYFHFQRLSLFGKHFELQHTVSYFFFNLLQVTLEANLLVTGIFEFSYCFLRGKAIIKSAISTKLPAAIIVQKTCSREPIVVSLPLHLQLPPLRQRVLIKFTVARLTATTAAHARNH